MELKCPVCGKAFVKRNGRQRFCSSVCQTKDENAKRRTDRVKKCVVCGKEFRALHGNPVVCSNECRRIHSRDIDRAYKLKHAVHRFYKCDRCGKVFQVVGHWYRYCEACRAMGFGKSGKAASVRSEFGLTAEQMRDVEYAQDRLPAEKLYAASQTWTPKQRKYAIARYNQKYMQPVTYRFN